MAPYRHPETPGNKLKPCPGWRRNTRAESYSIPRKVTEGIASRLTQSERLLVAHAAGAINCQKAATIGFPGADRAYMTGRQHWYIQR